LCSCSRLKKARGGVKKVEIKELAAANKLYNKKIAEEKRK
jgi:hypothetical protein